MNKIRKKWRKWFAIPLAVVLVAGTVLGVQMTRQTAPVYASNVAVTNTTLTGQDTTNDFTLVQFDMSWDYSWRDSVNWDAVWVFVKYRIDGGSWAHATLSDTSGDHSVPAGFTVEAVSDGTGVLIYRSGLDSGTSSLTGVQLRWNYGTGGDLLADDALVEGKVFAIEMVYIPQDSFWVGDADADQTNNFYEGTTSGPLQITSEGEITVANTAGNLFYDVGGGDQSGPIVAAFPKGYNDFYVMKYEISQGQYAELLNTLTTTQAAARFEYHWASRNVLKLIGGVHGADYSDDGILGDADDGDWISMNFLSWADAAAYTDWAGLRPMTELEFEKIGRGNQAVLDDEYAWGTATIVQATGITNAKEAGEVSSTDANAVYGNHASVIGPLRGGALTSASDTREEAGASYYGAMELSGNLREIVVSVGNTQGRLFDGAHGDGALDSAGDANVANWPNNSGADSGTGLRGGSWFDVTAYATIADRSAGISDVNTRANNIGFRAVRTAP